MAEKTPAQTVRDFFENTMNNLVFPDETAKACKAFEEVADLNKWYAKRCQWLTEQLGEAQLAKVQK